MHMDSNYFKNKIITGFKSIIKDNVMKSFYFQRSQWKLPGGNRSILNTFIKTWPSLTLFFLSYIMNTKREAGRITKSLTLIEVLSAIIAVMRRRVLKITKKQQC
ncbi:hypothetical protein BAU29_22580 [Bacillus sp. P14-1]|nr:hypothetical protein BAU29_22580 [Bacillus sp. P14-1]